MHFSVDGHLVCFHVLSTVNSNAMNVGVHVLFESWFSPDICPGVGLLDQKLDFQFFKEPLYCSP